MPVFVPDEVVTAAKINQLNHVHTEAVEATDQTSITSTTFAAGTPVCGLTFVATDTWAFIVLSGYISITLTGAVARRCELGWELRDGATIGSGTVITAADFTRSVSIGIGSTSGLSSEIAASNVYLQTGLTVGSSYNLRTMHRVNNTSATGFVGDRRIGVI